MRVKNLSWAGYVIFIIDNSLNPFLNTDAEKDEVSISQNGRLCLFHKDIHRIFPSEKSALAYLKKSPWGKKPLSVRIAWVQRFDSTIHSDGPKIL